jgi:hypothetical protein
MYSLEIAINVHCKRPCKKLQRQGAQIPRNAAYFFTRDLQVIRRNKPAPAKAGDGCRATQHMDSHALQGILRGRQ